MVVYLNNKQFEFSHVKSLQQIILDDLNLAHSKGVAVAVNQEVIPKAAWGSYLIKENDKITVIKATQGG